MAGTVTFSKLGDWGQFGNQLFQIAAVLGYAHRHGATPQLPRWHCRLSGCDYEERFPGIKAYYGVPGGLLYNEPSFAFTAIPYAERIDIRGNFQSERYFSHCADTIRPLFAEPHEVARDIDRFLAEQGLSAFAACHVRFYAHPTRDRGMGPMECLPLGYYAAALRRIGRELPLVVTTDNPGLLNAALDLIRPQADIIRPRLSSHLADFFLLSRARRLAISNSSFSWWAAWLGLEKELIVAPHRYYWFDRTVRHHPFWDTRDLYPARFQEISW